MLAPNKTNYLKLLPVLPAIHKWADVQGIGDCDVQVIFKIPYQCTQDKKLQNFQFKLLHKILPTKNLLLKMAVKDNAQCNFCNFSPDSLSHIYFECDKIKELWNSIQNVLNDLLETDNEILEITESLVICGYTGGES